MFLLILSFGTQVGIRACIKSNYSGTGPSKPGDHESGHGQIDERLTTGVRALKIAREPTIVGDPGIGAFNDPSSGEDMEAFGNDRVPLDFFSLFDPHRANARPRMVDDIETHMHVVFDPLLEWIASIPAIRPDHLEARQLSDKRVEHLFAPFAIAAVSAKHFDRDQEALRIDQQMPFSALNFFSRRHSLAHRHEPNWF